MKRLLGILLLLAVPASAEQPVFTGEMWQAIRPVYTKILEHPFLEGLSDGSLPRSHFQFFLVQDSHYLRAFGQALSVLAAKAPRAEWSITLNQHAANALIEERRLHESILGSYGLSQSAIDATPIATANYAYTNHLLVAAYQRPFGEGLAALLPCYWIYWETGKELKKRGSRNPDYQRWIDQYAGEDYGKVVQQVLDIMNTEAATMNAGSRRAAKDLFVLSARYEYMFWDMAWREENWENWDGGNFSAR